MKFVWIFLLFISSSAFGQNNEYIFLDPDDLPNCKAITNGKFKTATSSINDYIMEISDNVITEYVQDKKYYVRSKLKFTTPCSYTATIIEVTIPNYNLKPGTVFSNEIIETDHNFLKIRARLNDKEYITVIEKL